MTITATHKKLDLKQVIADKIYLKIKELVGDSNTKTIWLNTIVDNIVIVENKYGYVRFIKENGTGISARITNAEHLVKVYEQLKNNEIEIT